MAREEIFFGINVDTGDVIKDFGTLKKRTKELKKELDGTEIGTKRFEELKNEISQNQATIRRFNRELRQTKSLATRVGQGVTNAFKSAGVFLAGAFAVDKIIDFGKAVFDLSKELGGLTNQIQQLTGSSEESAQALANQAKALEQVYGTDAQETILAANSVAQQFGITTEEALNKINIGFASGLNNSGEFLDILKEYPALLKEVGLNADETFAIIDASVQSGVFSDKGIDAIKEAGLRLREFTPATEEALKGIGLNTQLIQQQLTNGTRTVFDVIQQVSGKLGELPPQSKEVGTAIADIFGGPGEDAGLAFLTTLQGIDTSFESITANLSDYEQAQLNLVSAQTNLNRLVNDYFGQNSEGFTRVKADVLDFVANGLRKLLEGGVSLINTFIELFNESASFRGVLKGIGLAAEIAFNIIKVNAKSAIDAFKGLFNALDAAISGEFTEAFNILDDAGNSIIENYKQTGKDIAESFKEAFEESLNPKEKVKLLDFTAGTEGQQVVQQTTQSSYNLGKANAKGYIKGVEDTFEEEAFNISQALREIQEAGGTDDGVVELLRMQTDAIVAESDRQVQAELDKSRKLKAIEIETTNARLAAQSQLLQGTLAILNRDEEARKSNAKLIKAVAIADVIVNTQRALQNIWASASSPLSLDNLLSGGLSIPPKIALLSAGAIAQGATSAALIAAQKFQRGGILQGASHANGGIPIMAGGGMVEAEGGEAIINKKSTAQFAPILSAINSYGGNGDKFERGGLLGTPSTTKIGDTTNAQLLGALNNVNFNPTVSVVEINEAQTRISELNTSSQL